MNIFITGINGFIGKHLAKHLVSKGFCVFGVDRDFQADETISKIVIYRQGDVSEITNWDDYLKDIGIVVHLAAKVHEMSKKSSEEEYNRVNAYATKTLAEAAVKNNVKKFIFLSTIKVNGEETGEKAFTEKDNPCPEDVYAVSKYKAEEFLVKITDLDVTIIRIPLVYGPGVKGNLLRLIKLTDKGLPLPLKSFQNKRSMIAVRNLCDLIATCCEKTYDGFCLYLASDSEVMTVPELIAHISSCLNKRPRLFSCHQSIVKSVAMLTGKQALYQRLCSSLEVDSTKVKKELNWQPPQTMREGFKETVEWYVKEGVRLKA